MWTPTKNKKYGVAIYNYSGNTKCGLRLEIGEAVQILEECGGWYRGFSTRNKPVKGIFPASYVCLKAFSITNEGLFETVVPVEDPVVREIACVLREWHTLWKKLYMRRESTLFFRLQKVMLDLIEWRRQLTTGTLTQDQIRELKSRITQKIDWGNRQLGLDMVPRIDSEMVDADALSPVELYQVHVRSSENLPGPHGRGTVRHKESQQILTHHLYLVVRDFGCAVGEDVEVQFSIYDAQQAEFISERYLVKITKCGQSNFIERLNSHCTIFTDLGNADLKRELYLVVHILRIGRMLTDSKKSVAQMYKRPYGCAVLNICDILLEKNHCLLEDERELSAKIYTCNENDFFQLHECLIKKQSNKYSLISGQPNYGFVFSLRMLHGQLSQLQLENPLLFKNLTITYKRGFSDVIMPGDVRNDLYFTLERAEFEKGGKSTGKNIEALVVLVNTEGQLLECISPGSGHDDVTEYQSMVLYHNNSPRWSDMIKLAIPIEKFDSTHVRIEYRHCSTRDREKKLLGFSFIQLMDERGIILKNGAHELYVYKCEDRTKLNDPRSYLSLPSGPKDGTTNPSSVGCSAVPPSPPPLPGSLISQLFIRSIRETATVHTLLCSTKLTQNGDLLDLLKWKTHPDRIQDTLQKVTKLNGEEIVKFLQDILDALFSMFSTGDGNSTAHSGLVFKVLVHIFNLLEDSKFEHFKSVMDTYITDHFAAALVYKGLLSCVKFRADIIKETDKQEAIQKCFRSLEYIFKFIIQSRILFARATGDQNEEAFKSDLFTLFNSFNRVLAISHDSNILITQITLMNSFSQIYEQLLKVLSVQEVARAMKMTLDCLASDPPISLVQAKLQCIHNIVRSPIFQDPESRLELLDAFTRHLKQHMSHQQELQLCADIMGDMLNFIHKRRDQLQSTWHSGSQDGVATQKSHLSLYDTRREIEILVFGLLETLIRSVRGIDKTSSVAGPLVACLITLLRLMDQQHYCLLWEKFGDKWQRSDRKQFKEFLLNAFVVFREFVEQDVFPQDWMVMRMVTNYVTLCALEEFCQPLMLDFLQGSAFDEQLWNNYFMLAVAFLTQSSLQLETFSEAKQEKILEKYGDMRVLMGFQILTMWDKLGEHKVSFIPAMVGPFLEVTLVPETDLRKATLPIFFDMMDCEQRSKGNFKQVESELIDKLDILVSENKGDDEYRQLFNTMLLDKVRSNDPVWKENGIAFVNSITRLLERLLDYRSVMDGEENRDKRMSCTVNLLNFYKNEINRKEMYIRYIYKLRDLHLPAENYTEAAFTLKLHSDLLSWSSKMLPADQHYQEQPEWQRRETLYLKIIEYFDKGKCWEEGIPLCKELAELYEKKLFDYSKLSSILKTQASFFDNILTMLRPEPEYFSVGFYGMGFPLFLRNKIFIYRGLEYERIGAFTQRLQTEFPQAQILTKSTAPDDRIMNSDFQYIQICNVKPIPEPRPEFQGHDLPERVLSYYLVNDVCSFQFDRPVHKGPIDRDNEFKSLWIERTTFTTASRLPGILRWFEVVNHCVEELSPVAYACETVENMNKELQRLIAQYTAEPQRSISPLSMRLQGVIEAAVNGGIAKYQEAFFTPKFVSQNPEYCEKIGQLKSLILQKVRILEGGLSLHGRLAPQEVLPLHRRLVDRFTFMKQSIQDCGSPDMVSHLFAPPSSNRNSEIDSIDLRRPSIINTPLPPVPGEFLFKKPPPEPGGSNRSSSSGSSIYGHLLPEVVSDEEDIYSRPQDYSEAVPPSSEKASPPPLPPPVCRSSGSSSTTPPPIPSRPRSVALGTLPDGKPPATECSSRTIHCPVHEYPLSPHDPPEEGPLPPIVCTYSMPRPSQQQLHSRTTSPKMLTEWSHTVDGGVTLQHACGNLLSPLGCTSASISPTPSTCSRNSWSEQGSESAICSDDEAPPLPPRVGSNKRMIQSFNSLEESKPVLPRRSIKKQESHPLIMHNYELENIPVLTQHGREASSVSTFSPLSTSESSSSPVHIAFGHNGSSSSIDIMRPQPPLPTKRSANISNVSSPNHVPTISPATTPTTIDPTSTYMLSNTLLMFDPESNQSVLFSTLPDTQI